MCAVFTRRKGPRATLVGLSLLGLACHNPSTQLPIEPKPETAEEAQPGEARERLEPLPVQVVADLLPGETIALAQASDPAEFVALFATLDQVPEFRNVRSEARSRLGVDLFDAQEWASVGIDSSGPAGIGLVDISAQAGFAYLSITDPVAFESFIGKCMDVIGERERMSSAEVGNARVIRLGEEVSVVIREGFAVAVLVERQSKAMRDYVALVATIDPREALSRQAGFAWTQARLDAEDDGLIFVSPGGLLAQVEREMGQGSDSYGSSYAEDELEAARQRGDSIDVIREYERQVAEERRWQAERDASERAQLELARRVLGSMGAAYFAADLRDGEVVGHGAALIPGASPLRDLFVPVTAESPLFAALDEAPLAMIEGRADMQAMLELTELFVKAEGEDLTSINAEIERETGIDVLGKLWPAFDGVGAIALTEHRASQLGKPGELPKAFGVAAHFGLADARGMESILDTMAQHAFIGAVFAKAKRGPGWTLSVPKWHEVSVRIVDEQLVVSNDAGLAGRIEAAKPGKQAAALAEAEHPLRGPLLTPAFRMYHRWRWVAMAEADSGWEDDAESMLYDMNSHAQLSPEEAAKVPRSKAFKRKFKQLEKQVRELNAYKRKQAAARFERELELADKLGEFGMQIERLSDGLGLQARWKMAPGTNPLSFAESMMRGFDDDSWREYDRMHTLNYELLQELNNIRQADLDAAAAKR